MSKRRSTQERKKEILEATLSIIYEGGFYSLTIRKIAKRVGITEAAIYRHYDSKRDIIIALADKLFDEIEFYEKIKEYGEPSTALREIMEQQFSYLETNPRMTTILFQEEIFREYPKINDKFKKLREKREKILTDFIARAQKDGKVSRKVDPQSFALLYMGSIRISVLRWKNKEFSYSLKKQVEPLTKTLFQLLKE